MQFSALFPVYLLVLCAPSFSFASPSATDPSCTSLTIPIEVTATPTYLSLAAPENNTVLTSIIVRALQTNSTLYNTSQPKPYALHETYNIGATYCRQANAIPKTIQILTHGLGFDRSYWDLAPDYSWVRNLTAQGYATLAYDRLGQGTSDKPDPIQVVQPAVQLEILHGLVEYARAGKFDSGNFTNVVAVGHSFGSLLINLLTVAYPEDVDAAILTGFGTLDTGLVAAIASYGSVLASQAIPDRYGNLSGGYITQGSDVSVQFSNLYWPFYDETIFEIIREHPETYTLGELIILFDAPSSNMTTNFTKPVAVFNGASDWNICSGDCLYPTNIAQQALQEVYPDSLNSFASVIPDSGHAINAHFGAKALFAEAASFLQRINV